MKNFGIGLLLVALGCVIVVLTLIIVPLFLIWGALLVTANLLLEARSN